MTDKVKTAVVGLGSRGKFILEHLLVKMDNVELEFTDDALKAIARKAIELKTGARGLRSILERILMQPMFDAPDKEDLAESVIDAVVVDGKKAPVEILKEAKKAA